MWKHLRPGSKLNQAIKALLESQSRDQGDLRTAKNQQSRRTAGMWPLTPGNQVTTHCIKLQWHANAFVTPRGFRFKYNNHMIIRLTLAPCCFSIFFYQKCFCSFMWRIIGYWLNMLILTLPNFDFITSHSSLITAQMGSVTPPILGPAASVPKWPQKQSQSM